MIVRRLLSQHLQGSAGKQEMSHKQKANICVQGLLLDISS